MAVRDLGMLPVETREVIEAYVTRVRELCADFDESVAADVLDEVSAHVLEQLDEDATPESAVAILEEFGEPEEFADALCDGLSEGERRIGFAGRSTAASGGQRERRAGSGTVLGIPYELRLPTAERVRSSWWNPADSRVFTPRLFGLGWTVNFGALAVLTHLIRPDDEDEPFAAVPEPWIWAALAVPVVLTAGMALVWWALSDTLPALLPVHWGLSGQADRFAPPGEALGFLMVVAALPTIWAVWATAARTNSGARVLVSVFAAFFAALAAGIFGVTVIWDRGAQSGWIQVAAVSAGFIVPFVVLVVLARVNRREEWRRDIG